MPHPRWSRRHSASVAGDEFSDPKFHPFWAKAEELGVLIFSHPQSTPDLKRRLQGQGWLENTIGNPLDTTSRSRI